MTYEYAQEKFENAVRLLATGFGTLRVRLVSAFVEFLTLREQDLPDRLRDDYLWIVHELTKREPTQEGVINGKVVKGIEGRIAQRCAECARGGPGKSHSGYATWPTNYDIFNEENMTGRATAARPGKCRYKREKGELMSDQVEQLLAALRKPEFVAKLRCWCEEVTNIAVALYNGDTFYENLGNIKGNWEECLDSSEYAAGYLHVFFDKIVEALPSPQVIDPRELARRFGFTWIKKAAVPWATAINLATSTNISSTTLGTACWHNAVQPLSRCARCR